MRILHLDSGREMRGGQWQVLRLLRGLAVEGVEPALLAREGAPLFQAARQEGWRVAPFGLLALARMAGRFDLVHAHDARAHTAAAIRGGVPAGGGAAGGVSHPVALEIPKGAAVISRFRSL